MAGQQSLPPQGGSTPGNGEDGLAEGPEGDLPMSFFEHLTELRTRLVRAAFGLSLAVLVCYVYVDALATAILRPYANAWKSVDARCVTEAGQKCLPETGPQLQNLTAFESVLTDIRIAVIAGIFLAAPWLFYQIWAFIAPGLYKREKKLVVPFVITSAVMFIAGGLFCYAFVLPIATEFLLEYPIKKHLGEGVRIIANYTYTDYVQYTTKLLLAFGLMFEFPLAIYFLARAGLITHLSLLRVWRPMIVIFFVVSAVLTPPEPVTQILMAVPMTALYFASIGVAYLVSKPERERLARLESELASTDEQGDGPDEGPPGHGV